jgi:hypothetical protein
MMNKIAIPAILGTILLVAGMFAFMPVEKASTVHDPAFSNSGIGTGEVTSASISDGTIVNADIAADTIQGTALADAIALDAATTISGNTLTIGAAGTAFTNLAIETLTAAVVAIPATASATEPEIVCDAARDLATDIGATDVVLALPQASLGAGFRASAPLVTINAAPTADTIQVCAIETIGNAGNATPTDVAWTVLIIDRA